MRCLTCGGRDGVWIGQCGSGSEHLWIYRGEQHLDDLEKFFVTHEDHKLMVASDYHWDHLEETADDGKWEKAANCRMEGDLVGEFLYESWQPPIVI
jgi:hypothetical protein